MIFIFHAAKEDSNEENKIWRIVKRSGYVGRSIIGNAGFSEQKCC